MPKPITTTSTSKQTAAVEPVVLRQTDTTRLVFLPVLVDNADNPDASVRGELVHQRRAAGQQWEKYVEPSLNTLKGGEWVRLELPSEAMLQLSQALGQLYNLVGEHGVQHGTKHFLEVADNDALVALLHDKKRFATVLGKGSLALDLISNLLAWVHENPEAIQSAELKGLAPEELQNFSSVIAVARLQRFVDSLTAQLDNQNEQFWQDALRRSGWVLSQVLSIPLLLIDDQVYVGGKKITNKGGNTIDFLLGNAVSRNPVLVEIKTPTTDLVGPLYRGNVYKIDGETVGATMQLRAGLQSLVRDYADLADDEHLPRQLLSPRGVLIVGRLDGLTDDRLRSFELYRSCPDDIEILTFDELLAKAQLVIDLLSA